MKKIIVIISIFSLTSACTVSTKKKLNSKTEQIVNVEKTTDAQIDEDSLKENTIINKSFFIRGKKVYLKSKPHGLGERILNERATKYYKKKYYYNLSNLDKVYILQEDKDWVEVQHVRFPKTRGWVAKKDVQFIPDKKEIIVALEEKDYKLVKTTSTSIKNFYILSRVAINDKSQVRLYIKRLRKINKFKTGNIYLFDNLNAIELFDKRSVSEKDYILLAEHFLAMSTFDAPNSAWWLPYIDDRYIRAGGKKSRD